MRRGFGWSSFIIAIAVMVSVSALLFTFLSGVFAEKKRSDAVTAFNTIYSDAGTLCEAGRGESSFARVTLPRSVESIYATDNRVVPRLLKVKTKKGRISFGHKICLKLKGEPPRCEELACPLYLNYLGGEQNALSLADRILGKSGATEHGLNLRRSRCGVVITEESEPVPDLSSCIVSSCDFKILGGCGGVNPVFAQIGSNLLAMGDSNLFYSCCDASSRRLLTNIANYFGGSDILVVYEDNCIVSRPSTYNVTDCNLHLAKFDDLNDDLEASGFDLEFRRRRTTSDLADINDYDQLWLIRPGWCQGQSKEGERDNEPYCQDVKKWQETDFGQLESYLQQGGKILLTSDLAKYEQMSYPQRVPNRILELTQEDVYFSNESCYCGCAGPAAETQIAERGMMEGVKQLELQAATRLECN